MSEEHDDDLFSGGGRGGAKSLKQALMHSEISEEDIPKGEVEYIHDVPLKLISQIGSVEKTMREVLNLKPNQVIEFDKVVGEPMDVFIGSRLMCRGEIVVVNERYGIRISEVVRADDSARYSKN
ncbi:MAG: FliM/FliN family flagellar motor switch protein [bacterium]|nr:FliM/FliN family flagellar motor switch protein [bacterium]